LTKFYATCQDADKIVLQWLHDVNIPDDEDWLIVGDFNLIRSPEGRNRPGGNVNEMLLFNEAISHLALVRQKIYLE
jgi:hypothetical protein